MHYKNVLKYTIVCVLSFLTFASTTVDAQDTSSKTGFTVPGLELYSLKNIWLNTGNAAGLGFTDQAVYTSVFTGYAYQSGDFRRPQQGNKIGDILFDATGTAKIGEGYVWGRFAYDRQNKRDVLYDASLIDPFHSPFCIADTNASTWKNQFYDLEAKAVYPLLAKTLFFGADLHYKVATGAKQLDPRPLNNVNDIDVRPGLSALIFNHHKLGANFIYQNYKEKSVIEMNNYTDSKNVYFLSGIGSFTPGLISVEYKRRYAGSTYGGEFQYEYSGLPCDLLLTARYTEGSEDVADGSSFSKKAGTYNEKKLNLTADFSYSAGDFLHRLHVAYQNSDAKGIEHLQVFNSDPNVQDWEEIAKRTRSTYNHSVYEAEYNLVRTNDKDYTWRAGVFANYTPFKDQYILPVSELKVNRLTFGANGKCNLPLGNGNLLIGAKGEYSIVSHDHWIYNGPYPESTIIKDFIPADFAYLSSNYYGVGGSLQYSLPLFNVNTYIKAETEYKESNTLGDHTYLIGTLGFTF